jgi:hypothetical protein
LCKGFCAPCDQRWITGIDIPRYAAVAVTSRDVVVCEARVLRRRMKSDVTDVDPSSYGRAERLNATIKILIIESVLIVPDAR